jgi:hypothetical protein
VKEATIGGWSESVLRSRIADPAARRRHPAGSPDDREIAAYLAAAPRGRRRAVVLGMTPELRTAALGVFDELVTVERSDQAIAMYRDWVPEAWRARETLLAMDWMALGRHVAPGSVDAIFGDGVFGNLPDLFAHERLLTLLISCLRAEGRIIIRKALVPRDYDPSRHGAAALLARYRRREIGDAELGFGLRLQGFLDRFYDEARFRLDNAALFAHCEAEHAAGRLRDEEWAALRRYEFRSPNCILTQDAWESLLDELGVRWWIEPCPGSDWNRYYPIYAVEP